MTKRILCILLLLTILLSIVACGENKSQTDNDKKSEEYVSIDSSSGSDHSNALSKDENVQHTGRKLDGEINEGTVFAEGLAFVFVNGDRDKTFCINKEGYIVFEADEYFPNSSNNKFINGFALLNNNIYDTSGKCTTPESVDATKFYDIAFEGGYILTEKVTADYSTTKKKLGVMNMNFQWIVKPSESLYQAVETQLSSITAKNHHSYYYQDYICFQDENDNPNADNVSLYLNLKTGEITEDAPFKVPGYGLFYYGGVLCDYQGNTIIDLSEYKNISIPYGSQYVDGKLPVVFNNNEAKKCYFTFLDESGTFLFEPKEIKNMKSAKEFHFDGETLLILDDSMNTSRVQSYDIQGNLIAELVTKDLNYRFSECCIGDSIIYIGDTAGLKANGGYYYTLDFKPIF